MRRDTLLERRIGPILGRAAGEIGKSQSKWHVEDRGDIADPHIGVEQQDLRSRLLAQSHGHVDRDRSFTNAALRRKDADRMALAGNRCGRQGFV